ncbi:MAG: PQQ-binding-like beta-propeller repeat protein [Myxococcales bacterium]|nr:PQQ-binding-like beta-propeller repeat protein [Polyangiaceae bacterium]MDW8247807.1 PQQ-binding-like beta-propeller repeat protein [Myxococcales bacterium]
MSRTSLAALLALITLLGASLLAQADAVKPGSAGSLVLRSGAPHPVFRGDNQRTGRAPGFPSTLAPLWKIQLQGGIDLPAVASAGVVVVASVAGQLVNFDLATGKELGRITLPAPPIQGPLITSRGDRVVLTSSGECVGITPSGELRFRRPLPARPRDLRVAPLAPPAGGVILAAGPSLLWLDGEGRPLERVRLQEPPIGALVESPRGTLAVTSTGKVFRWTPPGSPTLVGSLGGSPSASPALVNSSLVVPVDKTRLVFFDLTVGVVGMAVSAASSLEGPPTVGHSNEVWVATSSGLLLAVSPEGSELERLSLLGGPGREGGSAAFAAILAVEGRKVAFLRPSGELVIWSREGGEIGSDQRVCGEPLGLLSDGERLVVTCRDGILAAFGRKI